MSDDTVPKSAYELAIERLRKKDAETGTAPLHLTDAQKAAISEIRSFYDAKLAQIEVLHQGKMRSLFEPEARETQEQEYRRERERIASERDSKIEKARRS